MEAFFEIFKTYGTQAAAWSSAFAFFWGLGKYFLERGTTQRWKEFETYHRLVKELVEPEKKDGATYVDRQAAVLFELRFYQRYYPLTKRMLNGLKQQEDWSKFPRLITEIDSTIDYISQKTKK